MSVLTRRDRPTLYLQARTRNGWKQISTGTKDKRLAKEMDRMWEILASAREWDLLSQVENHTLEIGKLYDAWREAKGNTSLLRQKLNDTDIAALVPAYLAWYAAQGRALDTVSHAATVLRWLFSVDESVTASQVDAKWLTKRLTDYRASPATRRKVHSLWSGFLEYSVTQGAITSNPMLAVKRPAPPKSQPRFYERDLVARIIDKQPSAERRAFFALMYGTAMDVSTALEIRRSDFVDVERRLVRACGTKTGARDRMVVVDEWAWPSIWEVARNAIGIARIFPKQWSRWTVSDWHRETVRALEFPDQYPLRNARHHWAVIHARGGMPIQMIADQLGHTSPQLALKVYGRFIAKGSDLEHWAKRVDEYERTRVSANGGAR